MIIDTLIQAGIDDLMLEIASLEDKNEASTKFSEGLAKIIADAIRSGVVSVTISPGILVQTTPATGTGSTISSGTGTGTIS